MNKKAKVMIMILALASALLASCSVGEVEAGVGHFKDSRPGAEVLETKVQELGVTTIVHILYTEGGQQGIASVQMKTIKGWPLIQITEQ